jgi:hypothetical protein
MGVSTDSRLKQYVDVKLLLDGRLSGSQAAEWGPGKRETLQKKGQR